MANSRLNPRGKKKKREKQRNKKKHTILHNGPTKARRRFSWFFEPPRVVGVEETN